MYTTVLSKPALIMGAHTRREANPGLKNISSCQKQRFEVHHYNGSHTALHFRS